MNVFAVSEAVKSMQRQTVRLVGRGLFSGGIFGELKAQILVFGLSRKDHKEFFEEEKYPRNLTCFRDKT